MFQVGRTICSWGILDDLSMQSFLTLHQVNCMPFYCSPRYRLQSSNALSRGAKDAEANGKTSSKILGTYSNRKHGNLLRWQVFVIMLGQ